MVNISQEVSLAAEKIFDEAVSAGDGNLSWEWDARSSAALTVIDMSLMAKVIEDYRGS